MRTISKYMLSEIAGVFAAAIAIVTLIFFIQKILMITEWAINKGVGFMDILRLVVFLMPLLMMIIVPIVTLFSILIATGRLSSDSEIIVMKSSGISIFQLATPVFTFASFAFLLTLYISLFLLPGANLKTRELQYSLVKTLSDSALPERTFVEFLRRQVFYVMEKSEDGLGGVLIFQGFDYDDDIPVAAKTGLVAAERARFQDDPENLQNYLALENGRFYLHDLDQKRDQVISFPSAVARLDIESTGKKQDIESEAKEQDMPGLLLSLRDLNNEIKSGTMNREDIDKLKKAVTIFRLELHERIAFPCACLLLALWALPLGLHPPGASRLRPIILSIIVSMMFYYSMILGKALALKGTMSPAEAVWLPCGIFLVVGIYLFDVKRREKRIPVLGWLEEQLSYLSHRIRERLLSGRGERP